MSPLTLNLTYSLSAPPEQVWPILADTDRLNRQIGLPPAEAEALGEEPVRVARVRARMAGVPLEWLEEPFEFVEGSYYWVRRRMTRGPIREFNGGIRLEPEEGGGTRVEVQSEFVPTTPLAIPAIRLLLAKTRRDFDRAIAGVRSHLAGRQAAPYGEGVDLAPPAVRRRTEERFHLKAPPELREDPLAARLCAYLASAGDSELTRIRPFALARRWGVDRYCVLRLCLLAAAREVLNLSWDLLCPNCRGARNRWQDLDQAKSTAHCDDCQITFDADFDRAMEVTFRPSANVRPVDALVYCSGGPRNTPHIVAQKVLAVGETAELRVGLSAGRYRLRNLPATLGATLFAEESGTGEVSACFGTEGVELQPAAEAGAGELLLRLTNRTATRQQAILERLQPHEDVATAALVTVYEEFRNLFSSEILSPTTQMGIESLALMFTDLKGSTALYQALGDASAYALVRDHFEMLEKLVSRHGGGLIKTIGDSVMAAFPTTASAVAAALELHGELARFNRTARQPVLLKVGLHVGACIAARSYDERLDYFGSSVNLAARTHEQSRGDDIVVTEAVLRDPEAAALLGGVRQEPFVADLRGLGQVRLYRLVPAPPELS